jgi:predicted acyltransferase
MTTLEAAPPQIIQAPPPVQPSKRLTAVDALRGFAMFWIIGAGALAHSLVNMNGTPGAKAIGNQLEHVDWQGFRFYDLIFPLFLFLVGVSMVFSLDGIIARFGRGAAVKRVVPRALLLIAVGIFYYGGFSNSWQDMRLAGVLQRIGICYLFAGLAYIWLRPRGLVLLCTALLVGYWAMMTFLPFPDIHLEKSAVEALSLQIGSSDPAALVAATPQRVSGVFEPGYNLAHYIDWRYLPGKLLSRYYDPEGLLSNLPAIGTCLLGVFSGLLLKDGRYSGKQKVVFLLVAGAVCVIGGFLWGLQFPVIKKIWTSSYVLVAGGFSAMLLGLFSLIIDEWKYQRWCLPFLWMGMNSITIYLAANVIGFGKLAERFAGGNIRQWFDTHITQGFGGLVVTLVALSLAFALVRFLYNRKIFLRI